MQNSEKKVVVLIPCRNEELTVAKVVSAFKQSLPEAEIYVCDNNSSDKTAIEASKAGAEVIFEPIPGKGQVLRRMFADIDADVYVIADGDGTYDPIEAPILLKTLFDGNYDMVSGARIGVTQKTARKGHALGNRMFNSLYRKLFGTGFNDIFTGYRVLTRRFVKSFPAVSSGFEIEAELSVHASQLRIPVTETPVEYGDRPEGSVSKLRTFSDGLKILKAMISLLKENRPMLMFSSLAALLSLTALGISIPIINTYVDTGLVPRLPTLILATGMILLSLLSIVSGLILDSIAKARIESKRLVYINLSNSN